MDCRDFHFTQNTFPLLLRALYLSAAHVRCAKAVYIFAPFTTRSATDCAAEKHAKQIIFATDPKQKRKSAEALYRVRRRRCESTSARRLRRSYAHRLSEESGLIVCAYIRLAYQ